MFEGKYNTVRINGYQGGSTSAAAICGSLMLGGYDDWYLPSIEELNKIYQNIGPGNPLVLGGGFFANYYYWSSTEYDNGSAWKQDFLDGYQTKDFKTIDFYYVRAVRAF